MRPVKRPDSAHGFGLIEVLITLLVFSLGVLAVAGLQALSKKNNFDALQRTTAANLAESIIASMRANPDARAQYLVPANSPMGSRTNVSAPLNCYANECNPTQLAAFDLYQWELALDGAGELLVQDSGGLGATAIQTGGLASPSACVLGPGDGSAGFYDVIIAWRGVIQFGPGQSHACGAGRPLYGADTSSSDTSYQRFFVLRTYISP